MKILYYDCFSGISGDMNLAAMIDLGVPVRYLKEQLSRLGLEGYELIVSREDRSGIRGTRVVVKIAPSDRERTLGMILEMIEGSGLQSAVKDRATAIFRRIAEAEARVHGTTPEQVHFHEVGAVDSIVDIVGAALCFEYLKPDRIISSPVELGSGLIRCSHGTLPVPAPATVEILAHIPVRRGLQPFEATTPTGAAILAGSVHEFTERASFAIERTGYGVGGKESDIPNVLRVHLGEGPSAEKPAVHWMIECNIDDMNPELLDYAVEKLFAAGADDVFITPIIMKKTRSAAQLSVLCSGEKRELLIACILNETSTFGLRCYSVEKTALPRRFESYETRYGAVTVKKALLPNGEFRLKPEYDEVVAIARRLNRPALEVYRDILYDIDRIERTA